MRRNIQPIVYGALGLAIAGGLALAPDASVYAANTDIWAGEQITVTFQLPASTNLNWTPTVGESGVTVSEIANLGQGFTTGLGTISNVDLIKATTNTFEVTFTVPAPQYGILYSDVYFSLNLPIDNNPAKGLATGGNSTTDYSYVAGPPVGQLPEVPVAAALPGIAVVGYGVFRILQAKRSPLDSPQH
jgi:hypothetical protein